MANSTRAEQKSETPFNGTLDFKASPDLVAEETGRFEAAQVSDPFSNTLDSGPAPASDPFSNTLDCAAAPAGETRDANGRGDTSSSSSPSSLPNAGSRYRILRTHAEGGLGQVFVARDLELDREVALKEIKSRFAKDTEYRNRFIFEGGVTGGLEHPGIVPVYGLGTYVDGRPYYAMRFIRGETFETEIKNFHAARAGDPKKSLDTLALRQLLRRFVDVCNAIAYAHDRGVLHRDIKPCNIMLGKYGETLVVDWGLAKLMSEEKILISEARLPSADPPLKALSGTGSSQTMMGTSVGTPTYMAPELANGQHDRVAACTDIFLLGGTLYHLLAGIAPYHGSTLSAVLTRARAGAWPAVADHWPQVPKALAAICGKAMANEPQDRYHSARALAEDVERWLADEPVTVYREPFTKRCARWIKRHRTLCTVGATAALVAAAVFGAWARQERLAMAAREKEARTNLTSAHDAFGKKNLKDADTLTEKALSTVGQYAALAPVKSEALSLQEKVRSEIKSQEGAAKKDRNYREHLYTGGQNIGEGDFADAERHFTSASELLDGRFEAWSNLAELYRRQKKYDKAIDAANRAVTLAPAQDTPHRVRALLYRDISENPQAQTTVKIDAADARRQAIADFQHAIDSGDFGPARAEDQLERARLLVLQQEFAPALVSFDAALKLNEAIGERPEFHKLRSETLFAMGRHAEAELANEKYLSLLKLNANDYLKNAFGKQRQGNVSEALKEYTLALAINPDAGSMAYARRGWAYLNSGAELARDDFQKAIDSDPKNGELYNGRGYSNAVLGDYKRAVDDAETAIRLGPSDPNEVRQKLAILVNASCVYSVASGKARDAAKSSADADTYRTRAIELLRQALDLQDASIRAQYLKQVATDRAFDPIRATPPFAKLLADYPG